MEVLEVVIGQVAAVSKVRKNSWGQEVRGILIKERDTKEEGWVNVPAATCTLGYADYVQVNYLSNNTSKVIKIDREGFDF